MSYRGEDLDLRTPQTWNAGAGDLASDTRGGRRNAGPIWVDDTVLAVSNHAFDVALAHRAGEVRLEHLLHALTRIEAAAEALEARGVRVAALRRESATIIASEIPVGLPNGKGAPRRSEEFGDVLRMAAANAARRNAPAGIEDLLYVLFEHAELPGLALLARHTVRPHREPENRSLRGRTAVHFQACRDRALRARSRSAPIAILQAARPTASRIPGSMRLNRWCAP